MARRRRPGNRRLRTVWKRGAAGLTLLVFAAAATVFPLLAVRQLTQPIDEPLFPFPVTALERERLLLADPNASPVLRSDALRWANLAVAEGPHRASAWLSLAYAQARLDETVSPPALADLRRSYQIAPLDPQASEGRLIFALGVWDQLTPDIRDDATREIDALWLRCATNTLDAVQRNLRNSSGRLGLDAEMARAEIVWMRQHGQGSDLTPPDDGLTARGCRT